MRESSMGTIWGIVRPKLNCWKVIAICVISLLTSILTLLPAIITRSLIDSAIPEKNIHHVIWLSASIVLVLLIARGLSFLSYLLRLHLQHQVRLTLQTAVLETSFDLDAESIRRLNSGEVLTVTLSDSQQMVSAVLNIVDSILQSLASLAAITSMLWMSASYLLIPLCVLLVRLPLQNKKAGLLKEATNKQQEWYARISDNLVDSISGIHTIKSYSIEQGRFSLFRNLVVARFRDMLRLETDIQILLNADIVANSLIPALVYGYGGYLVVTGATTIGTVLALLQLITRSSENLSSLLNIYASVRPLSAYMDRIAKFLPDTHLGSSRSMREVGDIGEIELRDISFQYQTQENLLLKDLSLTLRKGKIVGVTGVSGSGKSTIGYLVSGRLPSFQGMFLVNGVDIRDLDIKAYRQRVVLVNDREYIFSGTIRENLLLVKPNATDSELHRCLYMSAFDQVVDQLPQGLDTSVAKNGVTLSSGQRQRLSLARAILYDPQFVVLDEITSSLDDDTETTVYERLHPWLVMRIVLLISHKDGTLAWADTVHRLDSHRLEENCRGV